MKPDSTRGPRPGVALTTVAAACTIAIGVTIGALASYASAPAQPAASDVVDVATDGPRTRGTVAEEEAPAGAREAEPASVRGTVEAQAEEAVDERRGERDHGRRGRDRERHEHDREDDDDDD